MQRCSTAGEAGDDFVKRVNQTSKSFKHSKPQPRSAAPINEQNMHSRQSEQRREHNTSIEGVPIAIVKQIEEINQVSFAARSLTCRARAISLFLKPEDRVRLLASSATSSSTWTAVHLLDSVRSLRGF
jgi:hypothetical protein